MDSKNSMRDVCRVDVKMIPVKITYLLLLGAIAALLPYLPVFMRDLKLTPIQMSIIMSTPTAIAAPVRLVIGYVADRFQKRNTVFAVASALTVVFHVLLYFTPADESLPLWYKDEDSQGRLCNGLDGIILESFNKTIVLNNNGTSSAIRCCLDNHCIALSYAENDSLNFTVNKNISRFIINSLSNNRTIQTSSPSESCIYFQHCSTTYLIEEHTNNRKTFIIFFITFLFAQLALAPLQNILDSLIYAFLKKTGKLEDFGKSRLWGTIGFGLCVFVSGVIQRALTDIGWGRRETYAISFVIFSVSLLLAGLTTIMIRVPTVITIAVGEVFNGDLKKNEERPESEVKPFKEDANSDDSIFQNKRQLLKIFFGFYLSVVMLTGLMAGIMTGCLEGFFNLFLDELDKTNKIVVGVAMSVSCICEVVVLFFSGKIISLLGSKNCLYLVFVVFVIRFMANSFIENPWYGLLTEASQCICFGLLYPIISSWASSLVPISLQSTVQCYLGAIYFSIGRAIGVGMAGVFYEKFGPRMMFQVFAAISGGYVVVLVFIFEVVDRMRLKKANQPSIGGDSEVDVNALSMKIEKNNITVTKF